MNKNEAEARWGVVHRVNLVKCQKSASGEPKPAVYIYPSQSPEQEEDDTLLGCMGIITNMMQSQPYLNDTKHPATMKRPNSSIQRVKDTQFLPETYSSSSTIQF